LFKIVNKKKGELMKDIMWTIIFGLTFVIGFTSLGLYILHLWAIGGLQ